MGRRKADEAEQERRTKLVGVWMTPTEERAARAAAKAAGLYLSDYGRQLFSHGGEVRSEQSRQDIRDLQVEFNRIGNNLNQLAFWANRDQGLFGLEQDIRKAIAQLAFNSVKIAER
jgi:hypothetical protein